MKTESTKKRFWQTILVALSITTIFASCQDTFDEILGICPEVESTNPDDKANGVQLNKVIGVTFNDVMDASTITAESFSLRIMNSSGGIESDVSGDLTYDGATNTMSFRPDAPLAPNTTYTGRVEPIVKDLMGNAMQAPYVWTFTTGSSPTVIATNPENLTTGVTLNKIITAKFSTKMDPLTIKASSFTIHAGTTPIEGVISFLDSTATFIPSVDLLAETTYTGTIGVEATNTNGIPLANAYTWTFNTGAAPTVISTDPTDKAVDVPVNKVINAVFSAAMDPSTLSVSTFTVNQGTTAIAGTVTYTGTTASFTPNSPLTPGLVYTGTITSGAKNTLGIAIGSNFVWNFTTTAPEVVVAPTVTSTDPTNNATNVALDKVVTAVFSQEMDAATISASTFSLKQGNTDVNGTLSYSGTTLSFVPNTPLSPGQIYIATITTGVKNSSGTAMASNYAWIFTTAATVAEVAPTVTSTDPTNNATNVAFDKVVKAVFSQEMDPATISASTFTVTQGNTPIAGTVTYTGTTASFTPNSPLSPGLVYTGTITTGAKNTLGVALGSNFVWNFTTAAAEVSEAPTVTSTDPTNNATNVALDKVVKAVFSQEMDPATISASTFSIKQGNTVVNGTISYSGNTLSFVPSSPLSHGLIYIATITTGVKNSSGTAMASNYAWIFTTAAAPVVVVAPTVISTDPANNATNVAFDKTVNAVFSEMMDPATITGETFLLKQGNTAVAGTVTYSGTTASFVPSSPLLASLVYTATITTGAKNTTGTALENNYVWNFTTAAAEVAVAPTVTSTDPTSNANNVELNKVVKAVFSQEMDPATITASTFSLKQGANVVNGTLSYSGTTLSFVPNSPLAPGLIYLATITTGVKNSSGTAMANDYAWLFTTNAAPTITSTDPVNNAINVPLNKTVKAVFSETMDPATITGSTFTLKQGNNAINGTVTYTGTTASFVPNNPLLAGLIYTATITTGAKNSSGTAIASDYTWLFTTDAAPTVTSTDPVNNAINVPLNKTVKAVFSETMDPATITGSTFTLKQGNNTVNGSVTYTGTTASFVPSVMLLPGLEYTATITTGAKNTTGTALVNDYVWTFTTALAVAPRVLSTDPQNNAMNVPLNKVVQATFSEPMNPATISGMTFTLKQGLTTVNGSVTYSGITASFTPNNPLSPNLTYTATITTGAQNLAGTGLADDYEWTFTTLAQQSAYFVDLKTAGRFGIFAATGISNNAGFSVIRNLDVGITPGARSSVTGFPPATIVNGAIYAADDASPAGVAAMLIQAKQHLLEAYLFAQGATSPAPASVAGDQGGKTLAPGIYKSNTSLLIQAGDLTLDAKGDPNAVWIFQIGSALTTVGGSGGSIILSGGAKAENIFWQVGSSATIGDNTAFKGNVLALTSITMNSNADIVGRMLVLNGAVVMTNTNTIVKP